MTWTTFHLTVDTPLFSGDALDRASSSPIRVPSLRGVLRFWFRAIAAGHGVTDLDALASAETSVFGNVGTPSRIRLRIDEQPPTQSARCKPAWTNTPGMQYLLGQGLWHYPEGLTRPHVRADTPITVKVAFSGDPVVDSRFLLSLWAMLAYGGLGARIRRGFGRLSCTAVEGILPAGWTDTDLCVHDWSSLQHDPLPERLRDRVRHNWPAYLGGTDEGDFPEIPTLAPHWWDARLMGYPRATPHEALGRAGQAWRAFRSGEHPEDLPRRSDKSPEWLQAIHGSDSRYPVAALGLPVNYYSTTNQTKAEVNPVHDNATIRRASPVWLVPIRIGRQKWDVFTHVFFARLLPENTDLQVTGDVTKKLLVPDQDIATDSWNAWLDSLKRLDRHFYEK